MSTRSTRYIGVITTVAGLSLAISALPPAWYGVPALDSYVFDPAIGSPLWVHRIVMPTLSVLGVLGVLLGWLFNSNVNGVKDFMSDNFGVQLFPHDIYLFREIPTVWDWSTVLVIAGGSIAMAFVAGLIPAFRAARMDPVKALRYE